MITATRRSFSLAWLPAVMAMACSARPSSQSRVDEVLAGIQRDYPCPDSNKVKIFLVDSEAGAASCHVVGLVMSKMGSGTGVGLQPSDTALVQAAFFHYAGVSAKNPDEKDPQWIVELEFSGRPEHHEAHVKALTGEVLIFPWEGGIESQTKLPGKP